jgi:hypothetical protein
MQLTSKHAQRGQALMETALFLPLFLLILFGMMWAAQFSVVNERAQTAVRYSGLISNESSPFDGFSLYAIYNNVGSYSQAASTACATPPPDAFTNDPTNGAFPGPLAAPFWQPLSGTTTATCTPGRVPITDGSLTVPMLLVNTDSTTSTTKQTATNLPSAISGLQQTTLTASQNFVNTPDIASIMQCYPELSTAVSNSIVGETAPSTSPTATPALGAINSTTALTLKSSC